MRRQSMRVGKVDVCHRGFHRALAGHGHVLAFIWIIADVADIADIIDIMQTVQGIETDMRST